MAPYWMLLFVPAAIALLAQRSTFAGRPKLHAGWIGTWVVLTLMIGLRHEVGGDWFGYIEQFHALSDSLSESMEQTDPAYAILNWMSWNYGWDVYGVNLICGAFFSVGLIAFCRMQPSPWLALAVAIPYLVIVVAMGYSRQGVAIGLAMAAYASLAKKSNVKFVLWIGLAAMFHKSAVVLVPLAILAATRHRMWTALWVGAASILFYMLLLEDSAELLYQTYIELEQQSQGAAIRVAMNAVPAALFLAYRKRLVNDADQLRLWTILSLIALAFVPLLMISPSSTAVDRVALYWLPLQIFVLSRLPMLTPREGKRTALMVILYCALVQFVWLNYALHAPNWIPYRFYLFESL